MRDTRTGIVKGTFWRFYSVARIAAYTANIIKAAFRTTGIFPINPDSVLTQLPSCSVPSPVKHQTILLLKTPRNRQDLRQHTQLAIDHIKECLHGDTSSTIAKLRHFAHIRDICSSAEGSIENRSYGLLVHSSVKWLLISLDSMGLVAHFQWH